MSSIPNRPSRRDIVTWTAAVGALGSFSAAGCSAGPSSCPRAPEPPQPAPPGAGLTDADLRLIASPGVEFPVVQRVAGGTNVLRWSARPLHESEALRSLERRMRATLELSKGVGIAAPQVGISVRAILVMLGARPAVPGGPTNPHVEWYLNPRIVARGDDTTLDYEGCLSIGDVCGMVRRNRRIMVEHGPVGARPRTVEAWGFDARIFQHEIDHLDGVLFVDRVEGGVQPKERLKELREQLRRDHPDEVALAGSDRSAALL